MSPAATGAVYLDTSALYALFDAGDKNHMPADIVWQGLIADGTPLFTCNYVVLELSALLQRRLSVTAVDALVSHVLPWVNMTWVDEALHAQAVAGVLAAQRRDLSLVDCASFAVMRSLGLRRVFTFDPHFAQQGLELLPWREARNLLGRSGGHP